jgi:hypothetical protein
MLRLASVGHLFAFHPWESEWVAGPEAHWAEPLLGRAPAFVFGFQAQAQIGRSRIDLERGSRGIVTGP